MVAADSDTSSTSRGLNQRRAHQIVNHHRAVDRDPHNIYLNRSPTKGRFNIWSRIMEWFLVFDRAEWFKNTGISYSADGAEEWEVVVLMLCIIVEFNFGVL